MIERPEATSRPHDTAISATTSARLSRPTRSPDEPRDSSFSTSFTSWRDAWSAGSSPEATVATSVRPAVKSSTVGSSRMSIQKGGCVFTIDRLNSAIPACARARPKTVPATASTNDSVSRRAIRRRRLAPSAVRMAISLVRTAVRAMSRLATFAHAMSITPNTAPSIV